MDMNQTSERALRIAEEITRRTTATHYRLVLNESRTPYITDSKIGGKPYWPADKDFPTDDQGNKMLMILQVNCGAAGLKAPLPEQGMLQWFISVDKERMYGCQGNFNEDGSGFTVIYHRELAENTATADAPTHETVDEMLTPVKREVAIDVMPETTVMGVNDGHFNRLFFDIVKEITGAEHPDKMWYQYLDNDDCLYFEQNLGMKSPRHQILGYPVFSQEDARTDIVKQNTLLFQLDSQFSTIDRK